MSEWYLSRPSFKINLSVQKYLLTLHSQTKGEVLEWLKRHAWKACIRVTVSRVRIPSSPRILKRYDYKD